MAESCPKCGLPGVDAPGCPRCGVIVSRYRDHLASLGALAPPAVGRLPEAHPAGFWIRGAALLIDYLLFTVAQLAFGFAAGLLWGGELGRSRVFSAAHRAFPVLVGAAYMVLCHWLWGQTVGKTVLGIRVVRADGAPLSLGAATGRALVWLLALLALGLPYLVAAARADKRALHDLAAGTRVERAGAPRTEG